MPDAIPTLTDAELYLWVAQQYQLAHSEWDGRCPCGHSPATHGIHYYTKDAQSQGGAYPCQSCPCQTFRGE